MLADGAQAEEREFVEDDDDGDGDGGGDGADEKTKSNVRAQGSPRRLPKQVEAETQVVRQT